MNIIVLIKQTYDTEAEIVVKEGKIRAEKANLVINPYDEYSIEEALRITEEWDGEVTVLTIGKQSTDVALRTAMAMGADKSILVETEEVDQDEALLAQYIAQAIKDEPFDILFGGYVSVDSGVGQVAIRVAEELGIPHISAVTGLEVHDDEASATVERESEGDKEIYEVEFPVLLTSQRGLNEPRYPTMTGIMGAKKKPLDQIKVSDLKIDTPEVKTVVVDYSMPPKRKEGRILEGETVDQVAELVGLLRNEAKVI